MVGIIQCVLSVVALAVAWLIPKKIRWEQTYENLSDEYRGYDYAAAVQGIVEFFIIKCKSDTSKIKEMYERQFLKDVYGVDFSSADKKSNMQIFDEIKREEDNSSLCKEKLISDNPKTLHFQRRLLAQFFCELDLCSKSPFMLCIIFDFILEYKSISFLRKEKLALLKRMTFGTDSTKQNSNENENCHIVIEEKDKENFKTFCSSLLEI